MIAMTRQANSVSTPLRHTTPRLRTLLNITLALLLPALALAGGPPEFVAAQPTKFERPTARIIVKMKESAAALGSIDPEAAQARLMVAAASVAQNRLGRPVTALFVGGGGIVVLSVGTPMSAAEAASAARLLAEDPSVEYAEPDQIMQRQLAPNDPQYLTNQTHYQTRTGGNPWGINAPTAWDTTTGSSIVRIAVIDTGIVAHADLNANVLPGYDMVSNVTSANDGDGRESNPADPGDWITSAEAASGPFAGCQVSNSSWHGSHVAGTIAAVTNNAIGVAGINWNAKIVPVRALGKCGGSLADIADGIRWAAGLSVPGAPLNVNPAGIINMSLGGSGACGTTYQNAIDAATAAGAIVVVAAGNSNAELSNFRPANCNNVVAVTAITSTGARSSFSNFGAAAFIAAPGSTIRSTLNSGTTTPVASPGGDLYVDYNGTSMATPHVAGVIGLMAAANPGLTVPQIRAALAASSAPFVTPPSGITCFGNTCGAGMLDAAGAVTLANSTGTARLAFAGTTARELEGTSVTLYVDRLGPTTQTASINFASTGGSATSGTDFTPVSGTFNWAVGDAGRKSIVIALTPDATVEGDETFTVTLSGATNAALYGPATATVTIGDAGVCVGAALSVSYTAPTDVLAALVSTDCTSSPRGPGYFTKRYTLPLLANDRVSVTVMGNQQALDTYLYLTNPAGATLFEDDDSGPLPLSSRIWRAAITASGTHLIYVTAYDPSTSGNFALTVSREATCSLDMDADGVVTAAKEGLVIMRALMGMIGDSLVAGSGITLAQYNTARTRINSTCGLSLP